MIKIRFQLRLTYEGFLGGKQLDPDLTSNRKGNLFLRAYRQRLDPSVLGRSPRIGRRKGRRDRIAVAAIRHFQNKKTE